MNFAFIGAGFMASIHALALRTIPGAKVVAVASRNGATARQRARAFGAAAYELERLPEMLARPDVDAVCVLTPAALHAEHARQALDAGKHVLVEKPFCLGVGEAEAIVARAERAGRAVCYGENVVHSGLVRRAHEAVAGGAVGVVRKVRGWFGHAAPGPGVHWDVALSGGGANVALGPQSILVALLFAGRPRVERVERCRMLMAPSGAIDVRADMLLTCSNGVELALTHSWAEASAEGYWEVEGDEGCLICRWAPAPFEQRLTIETKTGAKREIELPPLSELQRIDRYLDALGHSTLVADATTAFRLGTPPASSALDGATVTRVLAASYLSAATEAPIAVADTPAELCFSELWSKRRNAAPVRA